MMMNDYILRSVRPADLDRCVAIEQLAYEGDEAASREKIRTRIDHYPQGFLVLEVDNQIVGFINSGSTDDVHMEKNEFKQLIGHNPQGRHNVIMSVVIHPDYQGQGLSEVLMQNYILRMKHQGKASIQLMCKSTHIPFYQRFGFQYLCRSAAEHAGKAWHEMALALPA